MPEVARRCVMKGCGKLFSYHTERGDPAMPVCPECAELKNRGIQRRVVERRSGVFQKLFSKLGRAR